MKISVLERLLSVDRQRKRAGLTAPVVVKFPSSNEEGPWLTTLSTGQFVATRPNQSGDVGQAFVECEPGEEGPVLQNLYQRLLGLSTTEGWGNCCKTVPEAIAKMSSYGLMPKTLVIPFRDLKAVVGTDLSEEEASRVTLVKGFVAEVKGLRILVDYDALPEGSAILTTVPTLVGHYTRIYDRMGATIFRANRSVVLVSPL